MSGNALPKFVTFTGIDAWTDLDRAADLERRFPIEWGVLFSPARQGLDPRYPALDVVDRIVTRQKIGRWRLAAHLCGEYAQNVLTEGRLGIENVLVGNFGRLQINTTDTTASPSIVRRFAEHMNTAGHGILQCRDPMVFPADHDVHWLYDRSGGRGDLPKRWPVPSGDSPFVGYAGGLGPETIAIALRNIRFSHPENKPYWIDMESGVRTGGWLDLDKCEAVCRAVYPIL